MWRGRRPSATPGTSSSCRSTGTTPVQTVTTSTTTATPTCSGAAGGAACWWRRPQRSSCSSRWCWGSRRCRTPRGAWRCSWWPPRCSSGWAGRSCTRLAAAPGTAASAWTRSSRSARSSAYAFSVVQLVTGGPDLYFETAVLIIWFLALGRYFEARAKGDAGRALRALAELGAKEARLLSDGAELMVPVDQVVVGDLLRVRPGEKIPVDGDGDRRLLRGRRVDAHRGVGPGREGLRQHRHGRDAQHLRRADRARDGGRGRHGAGADRAPRAGRAGRQDRRPAPRGPGLRGVRAGGARDRGRNPARLVAAGRRPPRRPGRRGRRADHRLPVRAGPGHPDRR